MTNAMPMANQREQIVQAMLSPPGDSESEVGKELAAERSRSKVRVNVTYLVTATYLLTAVGIIWFLLYGAKEPDLELAIGVFSSVAAASGTIIGFWFGTRGQGGTGAERIVTTLTNLIDKDDATGGGNGTAPTTQPPADSAEANEVRALQQLLKTYAVTVPDESLRKTLDPGRVDGAFGPETMNAVQNFLSTLQPPEQFDDLDEPRVTTAIALLKKALSSSGQ